MVRPDEQRNEFRPAAGEGSLVVQADGTVLAANGAAAAAFGRPARHLIGGRLHRLGADLLAADGRRLGAVEHPAARVASTRCAVHDELLGIRAHGVTTWWSVHATPLVDDDGRVTSVTVVLTPLVRAGAAGAERALLADEPLDLVALESLARAAGLRLGESATAAGVPASPWSSPV